MNPKPSQTRERPARAGAERAPHDYLFRTDARAADPTVWRLAELEEERQLRKLILIASESICPDPVREVLGTSFNNLYTEGYPSWRMTEAENRDWADFTTHLAYFRRYSDLRYYRGCDYANFAESIAQKRIAALFATDGDDAPLARVTADEIFANVQPLSGAAANNAVYQALTPRGSVVVGMSLVEGGHLTHGSKANRSGKNHEIHSYGISPKTGRIDYDQIARLVEEHQPRMLIGGASAYPWHIDWQRLREIADSTNKKCYLLADVAHYAGLIAGKQYPNPIGIADVVSFTTHKSLCGPRGACLLTTDRDLARRLNTAVFPGEQGGPHQGNIAAKAVAFHLAGTEAFRDMQAQVVKNARALAKGMSDRGVEICYGGTDSHLCLVDLNSIPSPTGMRLTGEIAGRILDLAGIVVNKNTVRGDRSAVHPSAIRLGTVWPTQLGYDEADMDRLADLMATVLKGVHPFEYIEGNGLVGRGKVDVDLLDEVRAGVDDLIHSRLGPPSLDVSGYPHFDAFGAAKARPGLAADTTPIDRGAHVVEEPANGVLLVESERAHYFMQSVGTADVSDLEPGEARRTFLLDRKGAHIDDVLVLRLPDRVPGWRRYQVHTSAHAHARVRRWFRALSDGYVLFDDDDVYRKVEGPVMVEDLSIAEPHAGRVGEFAIHSKCEGTPARETPDELLMVIPVLGDDVGGVLERVFSAAVEVAPGRYEERDLSGVAVRVVREHERAWALVVPKQHRDDVVGRLRSCDAVGRGVDAVAAWRHSVGLPVGDDAPAAAELRRRRADLFGDTKVYFVGQAHVRSEAPAGKEYQPSAGDLPLRKTALHDEHVALGQKDFMVPFGGWNMPVRYGSIAEEHAAVRSAAGLFDVAHMGVLEVRGPTAQRFLDAITTNYVAWLWDGQCHYSYLLDPDGGCIDDILVYRRAYDRILLVVNAANAEKDEAWIRAAATGEFFLDRDRRWIRAEGPPEIVNLRDPALGGDCRVDLALQGPRSLDVLAAAANHPAMIARLAQKKRFEFVEGSIDGIDAMICTTGYTGEKVGFEILVHPDHLVQLWRLLLDKGAPLGLKPCGLGARDSTRIEAGYPLWGHELAGPHDVTPIEAGYGSAVKFHKPFFVGRSAMRRHAEERTRQIVRFEVTGQKRLVRDGNPIVGGDGKYVGVVTSNTQVGDRQVGMALVDRRSAVKGKELFMYRLPPTARIPEARRMDELDFGDAVLLPDAARVIKRFL